MFSTAFSRGYVLTPLLKKGRTFSLRLHLPWMRSGVEKFVLSCTANVVTHWYKAGGFSS